MTTTVNTHQDSYTIDDRTQHIAVLHNLHVVEIHRVTVT